MLILEKFVCAAEAHLLPAAHAEPGSIRWLHIRRPGDILHLWIAKQPKNLHNPERCASARYHKGETSAGAWRKIFRPRVRIRYGRFIVVRAYNVTKAVITHVPPLWMQNERSAGVGVNVTLTVPGQTLIQSPARWRVIFPPAWVCESLDAALILLRLSQTQSDENLTHHHTSALFIVYLGML